MSKKEKFALYLTPEKKATLERRYMEDGSPSLTAFIENVIDFYLDYLSTNNAGLFLPTSVQSYLDGRLDQLENRISSLLFKQAVELDMGMSTLADCISLITVVKDAGYSPPLRVLCAAERRQAVMLKRYLLLSSSFS